VRKFTHEERSLVKSIVALLSIKRIPESEILKEIEMQTNKTITTRFLYYIKEQIKRDSYKWYSQLREGEFEFIHEFKERINEIYFLQKKHYEIIDSNEHNPSVQQASLIALHKLNVTLSNYFDVAPYLKIENNNMLTQQRSQSDSFKIEGCTCGHDGGDTIRHNKCRHCLWIWCPTALNQDWCPNPDCSSGIKGCKFEPYDSLRKWLKCECGMWFKTSEVMEAHHQHGGHPHYTDNVNSNN